MANVRPSAFEHAPTSTLVFLRSSGLQILRGGELARRRWARSLSRDNGTRFLADAELYDLASPSFPLPIGTVPGGGQLLPGGERVLRWCPTDRLAYVTPKTEQRLTGLVCIELATGSAEVWWKPAEPIPALDAADLYLAEDGQTWALIAGERMRVGQGNLPLLLHEDLEPLERFAFDLVRSRIIISCSRARRGLYALPLRRDVSFATAKWVDEPNAMAVVSPVIQYGEDLLGVVRFSSDPGRQATYEVWRFTEALTPIRRFEGFPRRRSPEDEQILLRLADGSLAWSIETDRTLISPAPGVERIETDLVRVVDPWLRSHAPTDGALAGWINGDPLDPESIGQLSMDDQQILARSLLESFGDNTHDEEYLALFERLVRDYPTAFLPHSGAIAAWSDKRLARLARAVEDSYWQVMAKASPATVDLLVRRIRAKRPAEASASEERPLSPEAKRLLMLLAGVDTDFSLKQLGPLVNHDASIQKFCRQVNLDSWDEGYPAVRRFTAEQLAIAVRPLDEKEPVLWENPKLSVLKFRRPTIEELDRPAFRPTDKLPQISLLNLDISLIPGGGLTSRRQTHEFLYFGSQYYGDPTDTWDKFEALSKRRFEIRLMPVNVPIEAPWKQIGSLGGRPQWVLEPAVPHCLHCGMTMFYVGVIHASSLLEELNDERVYSFHCDYCGIMENIPQ